MLKNLRIREKLILQRVVSLIPALLSTWLLVALIYDTGVARPRLQLEGLRYVGALQDLAQQLQQARAAGAFGGAISGTLTRIEELGVGTAADNGRRLVAEVRAVGARGTASAVEYDALIVRVLEHMQEAAATSQLDASEDPLTAVLATAAVVEAPLLGERLARARTAAPAERPGLDALIAESARRLTRSVGRALQLEPSLAPALQQAADDLASVGGDGRAVGSDQIAGAAGAVAALQSGLRDRLDTLLEDRRAHEKARIRNTLIIIVMLVFVSSGVGLALERTLVQPLATVVIAANRIADGDLAIELPAQKRGDELGTLEQACRRMVASLNAMIQVAGQMAEGNLAVVVQPQSDRDRLGRALQDTVRELSALVGKVQRSGIQVASSVNEIAATAKQQQATAGEVAATTLQVGATAREIAATARELQAVVSDVARVADESARVAGNGQAGLSRMSQTMQSVTKAAGGITARLGVLSDKAGNISQVVTTINKVADQTSLLSLNAAIEAEKAGEYGRGFSVVATEIRRLADQTAVATHDIELTVKEIQSAVSSCVMGMDTFSEEVRRGLGDVGAIGEQLVEIIRAAQELAPRFKQVNEGMQAQTVGATQITEAIAQLHDAAQQTVDSLNQSREAIDGLSEVSTSLRNSVTRFRLQAA